MKKLLPKILIGVVLVAILVPSLNVAKAEEKASSAAEFFKGMDNMFSGCSLGTAMFNPGNCVSGLMYAFIILPTRLLLGISAVLSDFILNISIKPELLKNEAVETGWRVCRDLANMFFVFILLYVSISTILRRESHGAKSMLTKVIIVALLINFSMAITLVVIDASNVVAVYFYNRASQNGRFSTIAADHMDLQKLMQVGMDTKTGTIEQMANALSLGPRILTFSLSAIFNIIASFVFFAIAILLLLRMVILWFVIMLSPLAFVASVVPGMSSHGNKWWSKLSQQAIFAPALMFFLYLSTVILEASKKTNYFKDSDVINLGLDSLGGSIKKFFVVIVSVFISFFISIAILVGSLIISQQLGATGAGKVTGWGKTLAGKAGAFMGRNTIGRTAGAFKEKAQEWAAKHPTMGGMVLRTTDRLSKVGGGDKTAERDMETYRKLNETQRREYFANQNAGRRKAIFGKLSNRERAEVMMYMKAKRGMKNDERDLMLSSLSAEDSEKVKETLGKEENKAAIKEALARLARGEEGLNELNTALKKIKPEGMKGIKLEKEGQTLPPDSIETLLGVMGAGHFAKLIEEGDKNVRDQILDALSQKGETIKEISDKLIAMGNKGGASWVLGFQGVVEMKARGKTEGGEGEEERRRNIENAEKLFKKK